MSVSKFLVSLAIAGAGSIAAWVIVLLYIDPTQTGWIGLALFYATLACASFATVVLLGISGRVLLKRLQRESILAFKLMLPTLRQALWCTSMIMISLLLASHQLFSWFAGIVLVLFFTILEGFLYSLQKNHLHESAPAVE